MMPELLRILLVEDCEPDAELVLRAARKCAKEIYSERVTTDKDLQLALKEKEWDLILSDFNLPTFSGLEALKILKSTDLNIPFILVSGTIGEDTAVDAVKQGASDYVLKSNLTRLSTSIDHALKEKKAAEEKRLLVLQLELARKMEAIGRLAGGLAHDVNNVLAAITLFAELAIDQIQVRDIPKAIESIKGILNAQKSAAGIIRQLLSFSHKKSGTAKVLNFCSVIQNLEPLLKRLIGESIDFSIDFSANDSQVLADSSQIEQIVMNLAVNARDAMPKGGTLKFTVEEQTVEKFPAHFRLSSAPGHYVVLTAKDSGSGISPEILEKIFEPFFTTKEIGKGTGLGLAAIYGIIQQANGNLSVQSTLSQGTTFQIFWPVTTDIDVVATTQPEVKVPVEVSNKVVHILIAEDEGSLRKPLVTTLQNQDFIVYEAANGKDALNLVREQRLHLDLLLTDVVMPRMGGPELVTEIRKIHPKLKILFLSGYTGGYEPELDPGNTWFMEKPFSRDELIKKINQILQRQEGLH